MSRYRRRLLINRSHSLGVGVLQIKSKGTADVPYFDAQGVKRTTRDTTLLTYSKAMGGNVYYRLYNNNKAVTSIVGMDVSEAPALNGTFMAATALTTLDVSRWDTSKVTNFYQCFCACTALTTLDVSRWDTSNVTTMAAMFGVSNGLEGLDVSRWNVDKCTDFGSVFSMSGGSDIRINKIRSLDISRWSFKSAKSLNCAFEALYHVKELDFAAANFSLCTDWIDCFRADESLTSLPHGLPNACADVDLHDCPLTAESKVAVINSVKNLTGGTAHTLTFNSLSDIPAEAQALATSKNWTLAENKTPTPLPEGAVV